MFVIESFFGSRLKRKWRAGCAKPGCVEFERLGDTPPPYQDTPGPAPGQKRKVASKELAIAKKSRKDTPALSDVSIDQKTVLPSGLRLEDFIPDWKEELDEGDEDEHHVQSFIVHIDSDDFSRRLESSLSPLGNAKITISELRQIWGERNVVRKYMDELRSRHFADQHRKVELDNATVLDTASLRATHLLEQMKDKAAATVSLHYSTSLQLNEIAQADETLPIGFVNHLPDYVAIMKSKLESDDEDESQMGRRSVVYYNLRGNSSTPTEAGCAAVVAATHTKKKLPNLEELRSGLLALERKGKIVATPGWLQCLLERKLEHLPSGIVLGAMLTLVADSALCFPSPRKAKPNSYLPTYLKVQFEPPTKGRAYSDLSVTASTLNWASQAGILVVEFQRGSAAAAGQWTNGLGTRYTGLPL
ncbi:hypothetical protein DFS34DRAFT_593495 [Phlyctochytrium arcticum]|nr:hypothetical protein DFS34DRAFT_593495 [Phlyctochytrium arcticum]